MSKKRRRRRRKSRKEGVPLSKRQPLGQESEQGSRYSIDEVRANMRKTLIKNGNARHPYKIRFHTSDGESWKLSLRMRTFLKKGVCCRYCKIEGHYFQAEKFSKKEDKMHLNLYAIDVDGDEVLMTHDHIHPKSAGGRDVITNTETVCYVCNYFKKDLVPAFVKGS